ncbi:MAG TPA: Gfo/Idh/MocA family oxidoreductase, partial [Anaerolineae bacterium]|nr:Gfo/Idh/MocA family oxidoreductase [Anaerolineae bacterium]
MEPTRIGVIGAGLMGAHFLAIARQHPVCLPIGVADVLSDRAQSLADRYGVRSYSDYRNLLDDPDLDAVVIATGESFHLEPALYAAAAGKHMLIEKPLATSSMDGEKMIAAAAQSGVLLMVAHALRFDPNYGRARQAVRSGTLGDLVHVNARRNTSMGDAARLAGRTSITYYLGSHSVDTLQWVMNSPICEVTTISVQKALRHLGVDDTVLSLLRFQSGAIGALENSWIRPDGAANRKIGSSLV